MQIYLLLAVGIGGFVGAILRFLISTGIQKISPLHFPLGTLSVNVLGSFIIGFMVLYFESHVSPHQKALVITGMLGALTTFSTFSLESVNLLQNGLWGRVAINLTLNVTLSISATLLGMLLFKRIYS